LQPIEADRERLLMPGATTAVFVRHSKITLDEAMDDGRYQIGDELFTGIWDFKMRPDRPRGVWNERGRLPNPVEFAPSFEFEYSKFVVPVIDKANFVSGDKIADELNGYYFPPNEGPMTEDEVTALIRPMVVSDQHARFREQRIFYDQGLRDLTEPEKREEIKPFTGGPLRDHNIRYFGHESAAFSVIELGEAGTVVLEVPRANSKPELLLDLVNDGQGLTFNASKVFGGGLDKYGQLKGLVVQSSRVQRDVFIDAFFPMAAFCTSFRYEWGSAAQKALQAIYQHEGQSFLSKVFRSLILTVFPLEHTRQRVAEQTPFFYEPGMFAVCALVTDGVQWLEYHGIVRRETKQKE
jgi:hypothetical protein